MDRKIPFVKYESIMNFGALKKTPDLSERDLRVFEKVDGGNCQVRRVNGHIIGASRSNFLTGPVLQRVPWFGKFNRWKFSNHTLYNLPENVIVFGEWSGNHTIDYTPENNDRFFLIDVLDLNSQRFMPYEDGVDLLKNSGVDGVKPLRVLARGSLTPNDISNLVKGESDFYFGPKEGVVVKDYFSEPQVSYKFYHPLFEETRSVNGKIDPLTRMRYVKAAFRLMDEGKTEYSTLDLLNNVYNDVLKEQKVSYGLDEIRKRLETLVHSGAFPKRLIPTG